jgi:hypothetical protein
MPPEDVVLDNLEAVIAEVSGDGEFRFNDRQLLYRLRPIVRNELDKELLTGTFKCILDDYEFEHGEIDGMYREPRGSIYHPHRVSRGACSRGGPCCGLAKNLSFQRPYSAR